MGVMRSFLGGCALLITLAGAPAPAQQDAGSTVEERLLQILRERGVITQPELEELRDLGTRLRREGDLELHLEGKIDQMVARLADESPETSYKLGSGFQWKTADGKFALNIGGRLQVRFTHTENDDDEGEPNFDVPRARVWLKGHAFEEWWKYQFQFDIAGDEAEGKVPSLSLPSSVGGGQTGSGSVKSENRLSELKDAYLEFTRWSPFNIRAGQFKTPYSRHQLTSSGRQEFVDRAITDKVFAPGRSFGVMVFGAAGGEKEDLFEYSAGAFNGEGENFANNDDGLLWVGRLAVNPLGGVKYSESDLGQTEDLRFAVGVNAWYHDNDNHAASGSRFDSWSVGGDAAAYWQGFFFTGELHYREDEKATQDEEIVGWLTQLGYFLVPHEVELALRAANVDWDQPGSKTAQREYLVVLGYFMADHNLKIQTDFGRVELHELNPSKNADEWRFRVQAQIIF